MESKGQSCLLEYILDHARQRAIHAGGSSTSVEWIAASCYEICFLNREETVENLDQDVEEELDRVAGILKTHDITRTYYEALTRNLEEKKGSPLDFLTVQKIVKSVMENNENKEATADAVLESILKMPTARMQVVKVEQEDRRTPEEEKDEDISAKPAGKKSEDTSAGPAAETIGESPAGAGKDGGKKTTEEKQPAFDWAALAGKRSAGMKSMFPAAEEAKEPERDVFEKAPENFLTDLTDRVKQMHKTLSECVFGQDHAISTFVSGYFQSQIVMHSDRSRKKPCATFLFAGSPGVGKTFLAEKAAEVLELPFCRFDMSEYADSEGPVQFCGSDKVYKGAEEGNVTSFVAKNPKCVLLFDEIEKAHRSVIHLFLQMLDAGRLRDNFTDKEVSFKNAIIILTTNAGRQLYEDSRNCNLSGVSRKTIMRALENDINEMTGTPLFPAAICSRFASGNVVMFNHMEAHNLKKIVRSKVMKSAENIEKELGIKIEVDDDVCSAVLFAEGGRADARTVTGRAENFLNTELYELFRLLASSKCPYDISKIENIHVSLSLPEGPGEVRDLFRIKEPKDVLVFASEKLLPDTVWGNEACRVFPADTKELAKDILKKEDVSAVFIELAVPEGAKRYLNIEDIASPYMEFYRYLREALPNMPVYILQDEKNMLSEEECVSFTRTGARGIHTAKKETLLEVLSQVCDTIHQQKSMDDLSKYNKVVSFGSAQSISSDGKTAGIELIDFELKYAVDAGDSHKLLANISRPDVSFRQVIGAEDAKEELRFFADYLKHPRKYMKKGLRPPKGILLYGPPGTGKTMLAKAMAAEADMTFITAEGGQFLKKYVGEGPEAVHDIFRTARKYAPAILFVDEIDAIAKQRTGSDTRNTSEEILNAFLTEMDGFRNEKQEPVFVLAATNYDVSGNGAKSLDAALMRRFDRKIYVELPNEDERKRFLLMKVEKNPALKVSEEKINNLAARSAGMSLASWDSVVELALRNAMRMQSDVVTDEMLEEAMETFNSGKEKKWDIAQLERTARHEAGHAFICWKGGENPSYLTIVARGDHGGYMQHENAENKGLYTKQELLNRIRTALGGRAAEIVYYGREDGMTTGASGDLQAATRTAEYMLCTCGMDSEVGLAVISREELKEGGADSPVRRKINELLEIELDRAIELIRENKDVIDRLVEILMKENHIDGIGIRQIFEGR